MKNDTIFPVTRIVAVIVVPVLWLAFVILFFFPDTTGERFAWSIKPHMTSLYMGAGYLGGSWLFLNAIFGKRWHRIQGGFLAITIFTWFMLIATFLHWDRFSHGRLGFNVWLILYILTPFLVPALWFYNRRTDSGQLEESDLIVSSIACWMMRLVGIAAMIFAVVGFLFPQTVIPIWQWTLTPLTARVLSGWIALLGMGALSISADSRWSAWRVPLESILIWLALIVVAAGISASDFRMGFLNWYTISIILMLAVILIYYLVMEYHRRKSV